MRYLADPPPQAKSYLSRCQALRFYWSWTTPAAGGCRTPVLPIPQRSPRWSCDEAKLSRYSTVLVLRTKEKHHIITYLPYGVPTVLMQVSRSTVATDRSNASRSTESKWGGRCCIPPVASEFFVAAQTKEKEKNQHSPIADEQNGKQGCPSRAA